MAIWGRTAVVVGMFVLAWAFSGVAVEAQQNACNATSAQQCYTLYAPGQNGCWNDPSDWPVIMFYNVTKSQNSTAPLVLTANSTQSFALDNNATWNVVVEDETYQYPLAFHRDHVLGLVLRGRVPGRPGGLWRMPAVRGAFRRRAGLPSGLRAG